MAPFPWRIHLNPIKRICHLDGKRSGVERPAVSLCSSHAPALNAVHTIQRNSFMDALTKLRACSILVFLCAQLLSAQKTPSRVEQHIDKVTTCLRPMANDDPHPCSTLSERMSALHVPGVSIAVFHN